MSEVITLIAVLFITLGASAVGITLVGVIDHCTLTRKRAS